MKLICTLLLAGSLTAFAQETPTAPVQTGGKGITQDAPAPKAEHSPKGHKKHKKHKSKKQH